MNIIIPPGVFYIVGMLLVLGGVWRSLKMGRAALPEAAEGEQAAEQLARARKDRRRHMVMGLIWIGMGIFMILSTMGVFRGLLQR